MGVQLRADSRWSVHRCSSLTLRGEYRSVCAWQGARRLTPAHVYEIRIRGRPDKRGRCRPYRWFAEVRFRGSGFRVRSGHHSCCSVVNATRHADRALTREVWQEALAHFYSQDRVQCVMRDLDGRIVPFLSLFGHRGIEGVHMEGFRRTGLIPAGTYYEAYRGRNSVAWRLVELDYWGSVGRGADEPWMSDDAHWLPELEVKHD